MNILDLANQRKLVPKETFLQQQLTTALSPLLGQKIDDSLIKNIECQLKQQQMTDFMRGINIENMPLRNFEYDYLQQAIKLKFSTTDTEIKINYSLTEMTFVSGNISRRHDYGSQGFINSGTCIGIGTVKDVVKNNLLIKTKYRSELTRFNGVELKAIETLREIISESEFRKFIAYGFITVIAASGRKYQILRNQNHIKVWKAGKLEEEICIRIADDKVPKTDKLIAFKTMIEANEDEFRKLGNVYKMCG